MTGVQHTYSSLNKMVSLNHIVTTQEARMTLVDAPLSDDMRAILSLQFELRLSSGEVHTLQFG